MLDFNETESTDEAELQWLEDSVHLLFETACITVVFIATTLCSLVKIFQRKTAEL